MSLVKGTISLDAFHEELAYQILGSHSISAAKPPTNILTMIKNSDLTINKIIFDGEQRNIISDSYNFLSEFAHPNFHSYSLSIRIDCNFRQAIIPYDVPPRKEDFGLIDYIDISNSIFLELFDCFENYVAHID